MLFNPLTCLFMIVLFFGIVFLFILVQINIIALAFSKIGIPGPYVFLALFATLIGSFINIPVKKIPQRAMTTETRVSYFGLPYAVPVWKRQETVLAVNLGGAVIPALLSTYLIVKTGLWSRALIATAILTFVIYRLARPVKGLGIALPVFVPPVLAALVSIIVAYSHAPVIAYISGTLGTLIGADLLNMNRVRDLGAPVASIGGAGTFDGIFLNGILAVLLAAILA